MPCRARKYRQAAVAYVVLGLIVIGLITLSGGTPERKAAELRALLPGAFFIVLFALAIFFRVGIAVTDATDCRVRANLNIVHLLVFTNTLRCLGFLANFLGMNIGFDFIRMRPSFSPSPFRFNVIFLVSALLMACIVYMLARAGWNLRGLRREER
ncbi:MAG: hypothetical protein HYY96_03735 [Candidatus Tectomicrobia bacterium]|nr:hypothetical protein [Candidatus Tectomicrobia bacterium]